MMSSASTFSVTKSSIYSHPAPRITELLSFKMQNLQINKIKTRTSIQEDKNMESKKVDIISHSQVKNPPSFFNLPPKELKDPAPDIPSHCTPSPSKKSQKNNSSLKIENFSINSSMMGKLNSSVNSQIQKMNFSSFRNNEPSVQSHLSSTKKIRLNRKKIVKQQASTFYFSKTQKMPGCFRSLKILRNISLDSPEFQKSFQDFLELVELKNIGNVTVEDLEKECFPVAEKASFSDYLRMRLVENRILMDDEIHGEVG